MSHFRRPHAAVILLFLDRSLSPSPFMTWLLGFQQRVRQGFTAGSMVGATERSSPRRGPLRLSCGFLVFSRSSPRSRYGRLLKAFAFFMRAMLHNSLLLYIHSSRCMTPAGYRKGRQILIWRDGAGKRAAGCHSPAQFPAG